MIPETALCSRSAYRLIIWYGTPDLYQALTRLFNDGYRGSDLKPPKGWIRK